MRHFLLDNTNTGSEHKSQGQKSEGTPCVVCLLNVKSKSRKEMVEKPDKI